MRIKINGVTVGAPANTAEAQRLQEDQKTLSAERAFQSMENLLDTAREIMALDRFEPTQGPVDYTAQGLDLSLTPNEVVMRNAPIDLPGSGNKHVYANKTGPDYRLEVYNDQGQLTHKLRQETRAEGVQFSLRTPDLAAEYRRYPQEDEIHVRHGSIGPAETTREVWPNKGIHSPIEVPHRALKEQLKHVIESTAQQLKSMDGGHRDLDQKAGVVAVAGLDTQAMKLPCGAVQKKMDAIADFDTETGELKRLTMEAPDLSAWTYPRSNFTNTLYHRPSSESGPLYSISRTEYPQGTHSYPYAPKSHTPILSVSEFSFAEPSGQGDKNNEVVARVYERENRDLNGNITEPTTGMNYWYKNTRSYYDTAQDPAPNLPFPGDFEDIKECFTRPRQGDSPGSLA